MLPDPGGLPGFEASTNQVKAQEVPFDQDAPRRYAHVTKSLFALPPGFSARRVCSGAD